MSSMRIRASLFSNLMIIFFLYTASSVGHQKEALRVVGARQVGRLARFGALGLGGLVQRARHDLGLRVWFFSQIF